MKNPRETLLLILYQKLLIDTFFPLASLGYFNLGIIQSWPATALPSIRQIEGKYKDKSEKDLDQSES